MSCFSFGRLWVVIDRTGLSIEGGLHWRNNYRVPACGGTVAVDAVACDNCTCGMPYGGYYVYRDHAIDITWRLPVTRYPAFNRHGKPVFKWGLRWPFTVHAY